MAALRRPVNALIAAQVVLLVVVGVLTAVQFPFLSPIDEAAHFDYVRVIAEEKRLPVLGEDKMGHPVLALEQGFDPDSTPPPVVEERTGLPAESYQAFEPPLFYVLASPVFAVTDDWSARVKLVRLVSVAFLFAAAAVLYRFAGRVAPDSRMLVFSVGLSVLLWPGIVVRSATVANASLELLFACLVLYLLWRADELRDERRLLLAGVALGFGLLTKITLVALAPLLVLVAVRHALGGGRRALAVAVLAVVLPALLFAPWAIFNLSHYDAITPSALAKEMQEEVVNPEGVTFTVGRFVERAQALFEGTLPQDWVLLGVEAPLLPLGLNVLKVAIFGFPLLLLLVAPRLVTSRHTLLLVLPFVLGVAMVAWVTLVENWPIASSRRLYAETPALALFAGYACLRLFRESRTVLIMAVSFAVILAYGWAQLAGRALV